MGTIGRKRYNSASLNARNKEKSENSRGLGGAPDKSSELDAKRFIDRTMDGGGLRQDK